MSSFLERVAELSPEKRAALAELLRLAPEPIAIVGMACRYPGGVKDSDSYWDLLKRGGDAVTEIPAARWDINAFYDPNQDSPGKTTTRWGGFLDDVEGFDPHLFGISPREAASMDPHQRLFLEVAWEALENAGQQTDRLAGSKTGVFVGLYTSDYSPVVLSDLNAINVYTGTGTANNVAAGRLSYLLDLQGPSFVVDTACSSSLVAVHLACQSLLNRECRMAVVGGVTLLLTPLTLVMASKMQLMAADGRCKTFDSRADGIAMGEGCGVVILKRLSDAQADGDRILAVIKASAINQDGRTNGLTAPSGASQQVLLRQALTRAGISPSQVTYVEAHGTGTPLGDPIEVEALAEVIGQPRPSGPPCVLGSVKANLGHTGAAAGVAGLIKVVLSMQNEAIPPQLHYRELNSNISLENTSLVIPKELHPWPAGKGPRIAGISAFGWSGTNAHVLVEEAPAAPKARAAVERPVHLLTLSARTEAALREFAERVKTYVSAHADLPIADLCYSANTGWSKFEHHLAVPAGTTAQLSERLSAFLEGQPQAGTSYGQVTGRRGPGVAFLFTGQGSQYAGMGRQLYQTQPTFRRALDRCDELLRPLLGRSILSVIYPEAGQASPIDETAFTQPALFAFEWALAELWRSWGVVPTVVMGHSVGEYVAACVAGVFTLEEGLALIVERARLMQSLPPGGEMAAVFTDGARTAQAIAPYASQVSIAAFNGPSETVISGDGKAVEAILGALSAEGVKVRRLGVSHAFHSPLMDPMLDAFERAAAKTRFMPPKITLISNLTGGPSEEFSARALRRHAREPVRFSDGMAALKARGVSVAVEIGPNATLLGIGSRCLPEGSVAWLPSLRKDKDEWEVLLATLGALSVRGVPVNWAGFDSDYPRRRVSLPNYPFQHERFALKQMDGRGVAPSGQVVGHPLLGSRLRVATVDGTLFESKFRADEPSFFSEHRVYGMSTVPATAYLEGALAAAEEIFGAGEHALESVDIQEALVLSDAPRTVQYLIGSREEGGTARFQVFSLASSGSGSEGVWTTHSSGQIRIASGAEPLSGTPLTPEQALEAIRTRCPRGLEPRAFYDWLEGQGLEYGPRFRGVQQVWRGDGEALGLVELPESAVDEAKAFKVHPGLMDACVQLFGVIEYREGAQDDTEVYLPVSIDRYRLKGRLGSKVWSHARIRPSEGTARETLKADIRLYDEAGRIVAEVEGMCIKRAPREMLARFGQAQFSNWLHEVEWKEEVRSAAAGAARPGSCRWVVFADRSGVAEALIDRLTARGEPVVRVLADDHYSREGDLVRLHPEQPEHVRSLMESAASSGGAVTRYLYLWGLDSSGPVSRGEASRVDTRAIGSNPLLHLVQELAGQQGSHQLFLVTRGAQATTREHAPIDAFQASLWGFARTIAFEHPELRPVRIDLEPSRKGGSPRETEILLGEVTRSDAASAEDAIAFRGSLRLVSRLMRQAKRASSNRKLRIPPAPAFRLEISQRGTLEDLTVRPVERRPPGPGEVEIRVRATGLNFRDVLNALGMYPGDPGLLGGECAGVISAIGPGVEGFKVGDPVVAVISLGSFATYCTVLADFVAHKPAALSFAQAAAIPIAFLTAQYGLQQLGRMAAGSRVLIHAAAGGVGMAAVQLAKRAGAEVFATASSGKWDVLEAMGVEHRMNSRTLDFADEVMARTEGQGIDIVLNSLADDFIPKSLSVLRSGGRFLEIGKRGVWTSAQVAERYPGVSYAIYDLGEVGTKDPSIIRSMFRALMAEFEQGTLVPPPLRVFALQDAVEAFRHMALAKHVGKVVITVNDGAPESAETTARAGAAVPIRGDSTYLITGGLSGLGLKTAQWMARRGARHLVLVARSEPGPEALGVIGELELSEVQVVVARGDVSRIDEVRGILDRVRDSLPPLRGIVHSAGVLDDGVLRQQTAGRFDRVLAPKAGGAWNLHLLTRDLPLDFFVLYSSIASMFGSASQGNYAAANAFLDALAHHRRALGLAGLSINWGAWSEAGMAARLSQRDMNRLSGQGIGTIAPDQGTQVLEMLLGQDAAQVGVLPIDWGTFFQRNPASKTSPFFSSLEGGTSVKKAAPTQVPSDILPRLREAAVGRREQLLSAHIREQAIKVLGLNPSHPLNPLQPLNEIGLDSLTAVELKNALGRTLGSSLHATLLFDYPTIDALTRYLAKEVMGWSAPALAPEAAEGAEDAEKARRVAEIQQLSDDEVAASINEELAALRQES
uniref:StiF protein n=1 Tax=Stigmatella aurantiaca TaxID=41 RepID=Q8RJY1_STIAU|nr:StiF protein [Stigmatella aurantiaca Sg a15]